MAASLNKAMVIGNLGADPELRYTKGGSAVTTLSVATKEQWNSKDGERNERTEWHRVTVFGRVAENCAKYLSKGRSVYVEGRIQTDEWEDRDGNKRYTTKIIAQTVQFLSGQGGGGGGYDSDSRGGGGGGGNFDQRPPQNKGGGGHKEGFDQTFDDDDIPF